MKRVFVLLLALTLALGLFTACGKQAQASTAAPETSAPFEVLESLAPTEMPAPTETPAPTEAPLSTTEEGPFPGGLDDDGRGPDEDESMAYVTMTPDEQYKANIFLSNFAEQFFGGYNQLDEDHVAREVDFVHLWCKINNRSAIRYETVDGMQYEVIDFDEADSISDRYFPNPLSDWHPEEIHPSSHGFLRDRKLYFEAADGEAYNRIAVVGDVRQDANGTYYMDFTVYEVDLEEYFDRGVDSGYYRMTPAEAAASGHLSYVYVGTAAAQGGTWNGNSVYKLTSYYIW